MAAGDDKSSKEAREAKLSQALRANLRRRKAGGPPTQPDPGADKKSPRDES
jgi:hypothetical protein